MNDMTKRRDQQAEEYSNKFPLFSEQVKAIRLQSFSNGFDAGVSAMQLQIDELKEANEHHTQCCDLYSQRNLSLTKEIDKLEKALNQIGMLSMGELAYTKEFTEKVESICRDALKVEKRWPY